MGKIILISGGSRSGKSSFSLIRSNESKFNSRKNFIATAVSVDSEMRKRIDRHRVDRGEDWNTIEEPEALEKVIHSLEPRSVNCLDCLTVWLGNIWYKCNADEAHLISRCEKLADSLRSWQLSVEGEMIIVTNEVGWGIVPESPEVRLYRDIAGALNQMVGSIADEIFLVVCGYPIKIK